MINECTIVNMSIYIYIYVVYNAYYVYDMYSQYRFNADFVHTQSRLIRLTPGLVPSQNVARSAWFGAKARLCFESSTVEYRHLQGTAAPRVGPVALPFNGRHSSCLAEHTFKTCFNTWWTLFRCSKPVYYSKFKAGRACAKPLITLLRSCPSVLCHLACEEGVVCSGDL